MKIGAILRVEKLVTWNERLTVGDDSNITQK
jgi:hypothetical protein